METNFYANASAEDSHAQQPYQVPPAGYPQQIASALAAGSPEQNEERKDDEAVLPANGQQNGVADEKEARVKRKRASKACDACRVRKVKCDTTQIPCPQCAEHEIPCLFTVPAKKRGPPNAYVEAQRSKQQQQQQQQMENGQHYPQMAPFQYGDHFTPQMPRELINERHTQGAGVVYPAVPQAHSPGFSHFGQPRPDRGLEELATPEVINLTFDDFFTYIFPSCPILLESHFRKTLSNPAAHTNDFLALCSSMLGVTVAALISNAARYGGLTVEHTYQFSMARLGPCYRDRMSVEIVATLEYLSMASAYSADVPIHENVRSAMLRAEFLTGTQYLTRLIATQGLNFTEVQLLKRMLNYAYYIQTSLSSVKTYWAPQDFPQSIIDVEGIESQTSVLTGFVPGSYDENMTPLDISDADLEKATDSDGKELANDQFSDLLVPSAKSYVAGLNLLCGMYRVFAESQHRRSDPSLSHAIRYEVVVDTLQKIRTWLDKCPVQLRWDENNKIHGIGYEVQKAQLYVCRMHLSCLLLEECHKLEPAVSSDGTGTATGSGSGRLDLAGGKRSIVSETLRIVKTISRRALEANGRPMVARIRRVATTLVDVIASASSPPEGEQQQGEGGAGDTSETETAKAELAEFIDLLKMLETGDTTGTTTTIEGGDDSAVAAAAAAAAAGPPEGWLKFRGAEEETVAET